MALDAAERAEFEAHLDSCELCQQDVAEFSETAADLSFLTQAAPPPTVRANVLAAMTGLPAPGSRGGWDVAPVSSFDGER